MTIEKLLADRDLQRRGRVRPALDGRERRGRRGELYRLPPAGRHLPRAQQLRLVSGNRQHGQNSGQENSAEGSFHVKGRRRCPEVFI